MPDATRADLDSRLPGPDGTRVYPASSAQRRLWFLDRLELATGLYNVCKCMRLQGDLDVAGLKRAFDEIVGRHEILRTTFGVADGEPVQLVHPAAPAAFTVDDLSRCPDPAREADALRLANREAVEPFDLSNGPLLRVKLLRLGARDHVMVVTMHHIVCDGWSTALMLDELAQLYNAGRESRVAALPELPVQYGDFAAWERGLLDGQDVEEGLRYWTRALEGAPALNVPTDRPRPAHRSSRGGLVSRHIGRDALDALKRVAATHEATLFMAVLAAFAVLLHRYGGDDDLVIGTPIANRERPEVEPLVGLFVNTLALRVDLAGDPDFSELLRRVRRVALAGYRHQDVPFDRVVEALGPERRDWATPLVQAMLAVEHDLAPALALAGVTTTAWHLSPGVAKFDLTLFAVESADGLALHLEYSADLFDEATSARMLEHLERAIHAATADPGRPVSELPLVGAAEQRVLLHEWNDTSAPYPRDTAIPDLVDEQVRRDPDRIAIVDGSSRVSYADLNRRANGLAQVLLRQGAGPRVPVCVCLPRGANLVTSLLAILKTGGFCVPLDPAYPADRIASLVADTGASIAVSMPRDRHLLPAGVAAVDVDRIASGPDSIELPELRGGDPAYILYTSGSTGQPKGALTPHRAITRLILNTNYVHISARDVVAQVSSPTFDVSTFEMFGPLVCGATLAILSTDVVLSPDRLADAIESKRITLMFLTTSLFNDIASRRPSAFRSLTYLLVGGETADPGALAAVLQAGPPAHLLNVYGPTETSTFATTFEITSPADLYPSVPIGTPIANTTVFVLDRHRTPAPLGAIGEIYIGGDGVALGYHARPELTAQRFIADPFTREPGARLYRTGDRGRYRADGTLEILGRLDDQVKVRGFRVEPGEIEAALREAPGVSHAAVLAHREGAGVARLVAYVSAQPGRPVVAEDLRAFLRNRLPAFMVPADIVILDRLPLNAHGKVDRAALKDVRVTPARAPQPVVAPRDPLELLLAHLWEQLLGVSPIGIHDNFFDLGGHSLLAARMIEEADRLIGRRVPLSVLMRDATVASLADAFVDAEPSGAAAPPLVTLNGNGHRTPLFFLHGDMNGGGLYCANLVRHLDAGRPLFAVQPVVSDPLPRSIDAMADRHLETLRAVRPRGPYLLGGYCHGGLVAHEMARRLTAAGELVPLVAIVDAWAYNTRLALVSRMVDGWAGLRGLDEAARVDLFLEARAAVNRVASAAGRDRLRLLRTSIRRLWAAQAGHALDRDEQDSRAERGTVTDFDIVTRHAPEVYELYRRAVLAHVPRRYDGRVALFLSDGPVQEVAAQWKRVARSVEVHRVDGDHTSCITTHVASLASALETCLERVDRWPIAA